MKGSGNAESKVEEGSKIEGSGESSKKRKLVVSVGYCKFFPLGKCKKGSHCPYYHEMPSEQAEKKVSVMPPQESPKPVRKQKKKSKRQTSKLAAPDRSKLLELVI